MEEAKPNLPPPPPGVIHALTSGFNAVANQVAVILFPVFFDLFLWLGPRLRTSALLRPIFDEALAMQPPGDVTELVTNVTHSIIDGMNYYATLRTFPIGIFSLMTINLSDKNPLGLRVDYQVGSLFGLFGWSFVLTIAGWILGSLYFYAVARTITQSGPSLGRVILHSALLSALLSLLFGIFSIPFSAIAMAGTANFITNFLVVLFVFWVGLPVFFSGHAIFLDGKNVFSSIRQSFRVMRFAMPSLGWFALTALLISQGMDLLWRVAPAESWMSLVGILGHAFISCSLLAASFIFYRDTNLWVDRALEWLKAQKTYSVRA
jgi:hypothetical protein